MEHNRTYPTLFVGVVSISFAAVFIRLADAPAASVAALRMIFSTALLLPLFIGSGAARKAVRSLAPAERGLLVLSGILLALHFLSWIASLSYTGITSSIVFVTMSPVFIELYSMARVRGDTSARVWSGIALALAGSVVLAGSDLALGGENWKGDLLALAGAAAVAGYFIVGSRLRQRLPLLTYVFPVYGTAAIALVPAAFLLGDGLAGLPARAYLYCFLMALVCQVTGHSLFNWALRKVKTTMVAMATLGEPVGTSLLAWIILHEAPAVSELAGGAIILAGVFTVLSGDTLRKIELY